MKNLKVGDKVKVRADLKVGEYGTNSVVEDMLDFRGKETTIARVASFGDDVEYELYIDNCDWYWTPEMLEPIVEQKSKTYSEEAVNEMLSTSKVITLQDIAVEAVNKNLEAESTRLAKAVCEYEEIVHNLETDLNSIRQERDTYKTSYEDLLDNYNSLVDEYNSLVDDYNRLI